jgi:hypothetical protein
MSGAAIQSQAALVVKVNEPKSYGQKAIIKLDLQNTFTNKIESARAAVFLSDEKGKVVGQETRWIIGGTKDRPALEPAAKTTFNFVVQSSKPFTKSKVTVTRVILENGTLADATRDVRVESVTK